MRVVDAGVIVEVIAYDLDPVRLGDESLAGPHLLDSEVLSSLRRMVRRDELSDDVATRALRTFEGMAIERHPAAPLRQRVWELRHSLTAYDATYVALAERLAATALVTMDAAIAAAPGIRCPVELLTPAR